MDAGTVRASKLTSTATTSAAPPQAPDVSLKHRDKRRKTDTGKSQAIWTFSTTAPSQSEIFSVIVPCSYVLAFQYHITLPKWNILCYCSLLICIGLSVPQSEIFSVIVPCSYVLAFQYHITLPKWNILCYCSLLICIGLSVPQSEIFSVTVACSLCSYVLAFQCHKVKYSLLLQLALSAHMYWPFSVTKWNILCYCSLLLCIGLSVPQSEIFSVTVACSLCSYVLAFQYHSTLPKWNILYYCSLLSLLVCIGLSVSQSEIFSVIVACSYVLAFQYHKVKYSLLL